MQHNFDLMEMAPDFYTAVIREFIPKVYYAETVIISLFSVQSRNKISQFTKCDKLHIANYTTFPLNLLILLKFDLYCTFYKSFYLIEEEIS